MKDGGKSCLSARSQALVWEVKKMSKSPVKSGQGAGQAALTARPHGTPRGARRAEGSHGSDSILTLPLVRLALALARRGFTASAIHPTSATSRSVSVKLLQFTQAAQFRPPGCHVTTPPPLGHGRRQLEAVRAATWAKLVKDYLYTKDSPFWLRARPSTLPASGHAL